MSGGDRRLLDVRRALNERQAVNANEAKGKGRMGAGRPTYIDLSKNKKRAKLGGGEEKVPLEDKMLVKQVDKWWNMKMEHAKTQFTKRRAFLFMLLLIWVIALWVALGYKMTTENWTDIYKYFTNVTFFLQALFFGIYLGVFFEDPGKRRLEKGLLVWFFWTVFSQIVIVFILVMGVVYDAPGLISDNLESNGGPYYDGVVYIANFLFHVLPMTAAFIFLFISWGDIAECMILAFGYYLQYIDEGAIPPPTDFEKSMGNVHLAFVKVDKSVIYAYTAAQYFLAMLPFFTYMLIIDLSEQYSISKELATWIPVIAVLFINIFTTIVPIMYMFHSTIPSKFILRDTLKEVPPEEAKIVDDETMTRRVLGDHPMVHPWPT